MSAAAPGVYNIEDDADVRADMQRLLKSAGFGAEAFAATQDFRSVIPHGLPTDTACGPQLYTTPFRS
jgi:FixJ family two-component response regulator